MMKTKAATLLTLMFLVSCFCACGSSDKKDIPYGFKEAGESNDSIQGEFFGTPYGASVEELVSNFDIAGFSPDAQKSTDDMLSFKYRNDKRFGFEGKGWENLMVYFVDNQFCEISFFNIFNNKDDALKDYDDLLKKISSKYKMTEMEPWNKETIKTHTAISQTDEMMSIQCDSSLTEDKKVLYKVNLHYYLKNL